MSCNVSQLTVAKILMSKSWGRKSDIVIIVCIAGGEGWRKKVNREKDNSMFLTTVPSFITMRPLFTFPLVWRVSMKE